MKVSNQRFTIFTPPYSLAQGVIHVNGKIASQSGDSFSVGAQESVKIEFIAVNGSAVVDKANTSVFTAISKVQFNPRVLSPFKSIVYAYKNSFFGNITLQSPFITYTWPSALVNPVPENVKVADPADLIVEEPKDVVVVEEPGVEVVKKARKKSKKQQG